MKKKYLFISNSSYDPKKINSEKDILLGNVRKWPIYAAHKNNYDIFLGVNRSKTNKIKVIEDFNVELYNQNIFRNVFDIKNNYKAFKNLNRILKKEKIDVLHCNSPLGGFIGRIAGKINKVPIIIYTAHGFHFYKGAPLINNLLYRNVEKWLARYTDAIITMNEEDYLNAQRFSLNNNGKVYKVSGVGVDTKEFISKDFDREKYRHSLNLRNDEILVIATGDLIKRKNYITAIKAIETVKNNKVKIFICGEGPEENKLKKYVSRKKLKERVKFLGFRTDIKELLWCSDIYFMTSFQEGLPRGVMEAMSAGLPCVVSEIRGNVDIVKNKKGGFLCSPVDYKSFGKAINQLARSSELRKEMGNYNKEKIKSYDSLSVEKEFIDIFEKIFD